jgi:hypothetical protein
VFNYAHQNSEYPPCSVQSAENVEQIYDAALNEVQTDFEKTAVRGIK